MIIATYPGSFDPLSNGHLDIITRAACLFDQLNIAVFDDPPKRLLFTTQERADLVEEATKHITNVRVEVFSGLLVEYAHRIGAGAIVRGLRMGSDFEREFEMALMNRNLCSDVDIVCLMARLDYQFLSSSLLK